MTIEQRVDQLEKQNKRFKIAFTVLAVALCGMVSMAATDSKDGEFDRLQVGTLHVTGEISALGNILSASLIGATKMQVSGDDGGAVTFGVTEEGDGKIVTYSSSNKPTVSIGSTPNGGFVVVHNKTGDEVVQLKADIYKNGEVWALNRKGKGRVYDSK